jgi:DNA gyrase subunit A
VDNLDDVIELIRSAATVEEAAEGLKLRFRLSGRQAEVVLGMRLSRLTGLERAKLASDREKVGQEIAEHRAVLSDPALVMDIVREDAIELKGNYADRRRTEIASAVEEVAVEDLVAVEDMVVTLSHAGYVKRMPLESCRRSRRGSKGVRGATTRETDFTEVLALGSTHDTLLLFSDQGRAYWQRVYDLPQLGRGAAGKAMASVVKLRRGERVTALAALPDYEGHVALATAAGRVKRVELSEFANPRPSGIVAVKLDEGDSVVGAVRAGDDDELVLATTSGMAVRFAASQVRPMGRASGGVAGAKLKEDDRVASLVLAAAGGYLCVVSGKGLGKRTALEEFRLVNRGVGGVAAMLVSERTGPLAACAAVAEGDDVLLASAHGMTARLRAADVPSMGRSVQGKRLMALSGGDRVVAAVTVPAGGGDDDA